MDTLLADLRYALRQLARSPGFTAVAVLTLALGAGTNSPLFSVIHAVLLQPPLGRTFMAEEQAPTGPLVVLLSHGLWQERFGGDRSAVGRTVIMDGAPVTIVGVLPASFDFPSGARFWRPLRLPRSGGQTTS